MTALTILSFVLAAIAAVSVAGLYLAWPREMTAEEWVLHRREARSGRRPAQAPLALRLINRNRLLALRVRWALRLLRADMRLLSLRGQRPVEGEEALVMDLLRRAAWGGGIGLLAGIALWLVSGRPGLSIGTLELPVACAVLFPALRWLQLRRSAERARTSVRRGLPRILTGARVLLESGASTPEMALRSAVGIYRDPAADVLREALLQQQVRRLELQQALDEVGEAHGLEQLRHLADAYRVATRQGTQMADLLVEFAVDLRQGEHTAYRERMTRAPVLMAVPALLFFVLPLLAVLLLLVLYPLETALGQL